jgi:hypothetical protein
MSKFLPLKKNKNAIEAHRRHEEGKRKPRRHPVR